MDTFIYDQDYHYNMIKHMVLQIDGWMDERIKKKFNLQKIYIIPDPPLPIQPHLASPKLSTITSYLSLNLCSFSKS